MGGGTAEEELRAHLSRASFWKVGETDFSIMETHIAVVYLAGPHAYKMKKPVDFGYLDFSTLEKRYWALERELRFNEKSAPGLYAGLIPLTLGEDGQVCLDGGGEVVDWVLKMHRFDQDLLLSRVAARGDLTPGLAAKLGVMVAGLHRAAPVCKRSGWASALARVAMTTVRHLREGRAGILTREEIDQLADEIFDALTPLSALLEDRARDGHVRHCHGDLHLQNIVLRDGTPVPFDCIEFSDEIACQDTLYDLAFLLMDLRFRGHGQAANRVLNAYLAALTLEEMDSTLDSLALLPVYGAIRAAIRASVALQTRAGLLYREDMEGVPADRGEVQALAFAAKAYITMARAVVAPRDQILVAIGGLSGSGKSTLARDLAPCLDAFAGAVVLRSDEMRKKLFGVPHTDHLPDQAYTPSISTVVYHRMEEAAERALAAGQQVIIDAVFALPRQRFEAAMAAARRGAAFQGLWLDADPQTMRDRVAGRRCDASDATLNVLEWQMGLPLGEIEWPRLNSARDRREVLDDTLRILNLPADRTGPWETEGGA